MLLHDSFSKGKISFDDMLTAPSGKVCETYKEVCIELGLLSEDLEWVKVFEEAANTKMSAKIRDLCIIVFLFCMPSSPRQLFDEFWPSWCEDFEQKAIRQGIERIYQTGFLKGYISQDIDKSRSSRSTFVCCANFCAKSAAVAQCTEDEQ